MCLSLNSFCHIQEPKLQERLNLFLGDSNIEDVPKEQRLKRQIYTPLSFAVETVARIHAFSEEIHDPEKPLPVQPADLVLMANLILGVARAWQHKLDSTLRVATDLVQSLQPELPTTDLDSEIQSSPPEVSTTVSDSEIQSSLPELPTTDLDSEIQSSPPEVRTTVSDSQIQSSLPELPIRSSSMRIKKKSKRLHLEDPSNEDHTEPEERDRIDDLGGEGTAGDAEKRNDDGGERIENSAFVESEGRDTTDPVERDGERIMLTSSHVEENGARISDCREVEEAETGREEAEGGEPEGRDTTDPVARDAERIIDPLEVDELEWTSGYVAGYSDAGGNDAETGREEAEGTSSHAAEADGGEPVGRDTTDLVARDAERIIDPLEVDELESTSGYVAGYSDVGGNDHTGYGRENSDGVEVEEAERRTSAPVEENGDGERSSDCIEVEPETGGEEAEGTSSHVAEAVGTDVTRNVRKRKFVFDRWVKFKDKTKFEVKKRKTQSIEEAKRATYKYPKDLNSVSLICPHHLLFPKVPKLNQQGEREPQNLNEQGERAQNLNEEEERGTLNMNEQEEREPQNLNEQGERESQNLNEQG
ncbi:hypothetical protein Bca101_026678 [Brassica carinata]